MASALPLSLLVFYVALCAPLLALGRGLRALLRFIGFESWILDVMLVGFLGIAILPAVAANHGIGFVPWILSSGSATSSLSAGALFALPLTLPLAWWAMGRPLPLSPSDTVSSPPQAPRVAPLLKFPDDKTTT
jgi:hypothetical protein